MTTLRVHQWCNEYQVPGQSMALQSAGGELDRLAQRIADSLATHVGTLLADNPDNHDGLVLLPAIDVDLDIDLASAPDQIVRHWSRQLAQTFARALDDPASGVVRFPSRAAYHARFIGELVQGRGWDSWLYRGFDGLRVLPVAAVIRTLLTGDDGLATLASIDESVWPLLFAALTSREAVRVLSHWQHRVETQSDAGPLQAALTAWEQSRLAAPGALAPPLLALWLLAQTEGTGKTPSIGAACWLAVLLSLPGEIASAELQHIVHHADLRRLKETRACAGIADDMDWMALLVTTPAALRKTALKLAVAARQQIGKDAASRNDTSPECIAAPFGGLAWLLPSLQDLFGADLYSLLPPHADGDARDIAALTILAIASGSRSEYVWRDPFWRGFFRVPPAFGVDDLQSWLAAHDPAEFNQALAISLQQRTLTELVMLRFPRHGTSVEQAVERGSACRLHPCEIPAGLAVAPLPFAKRLRLSRLLKRDAGFLQAAGILTALPPRWRAPFETLAQAILRRTAWRIPGAACCSLPYLFANVLNAHGQARCDDMEAAAWSLELNRPPLHVLLSLNGMARQRLNGPGARSLALHCTG